MMKKERLWQIEQLVQQHEHISFTLTEEKRCFTELSIDMFELRLQKYPPPLAEIQIFLDIFLTEQVC